MHSTTRIAVFCLLLSPACSAQRNPSITYPESRKEDRVDAYFGVAVPDPYRWLEDDRSAETAQWVDRENRVTGDYLAGIPFRPKLGDRLTRLWHYAKQSAPEHAGEFHFRYANDGSQNQDVLYLARHAEGPYELLMDPNTFSADGTVALTGTSLSRDSRYLAFGLSRGGSDWMQIGIRDMAAGRTLSDTLNWVKFSGMAWQGDGFYYGAFENPGADDALKKKNEYHTLYFHKAGTPQSADRVVFRDREHPLRTFGAATTEDERYLVVYGSESTSGNEVFAMDLEKSGDGFTRLVTGFDHDYSLVDNDGARLLFLTNAGAPNGKVVFTDGLSDAAPAWKDLIPEDPDAVLQSVAVAGDKLVALYLGDAVNHLVVYARDGRKLRTYAPDVPATINSLNGHRKDSMLYFTVTSFMVPTRVYAYNVDNGTSRMIFQPEIDFDFSAYETRQVWYTSGDGTRVPMFIVSRKGLEKTGDHPTFLYGYGGFNISMRPSFSPWRLAWLEAGGIYAQANIRGGGEYGESWHLAGTKERKQNVFDDFIAAAEYLVAEKYTRPSRLAIHGRSNGGLLVGACMTQRPDLFGVALPGVGVLDMLRFHKFTIGWAWTIDYGSSDVENEFKALYAYSPLHNIKKGVAYPATLVTTADHDDRVVPAHSFKFIATLQEKGARTNPYLIRIDVNAGHGAGKPVAKQISEWTDVLSFTMANLGMRY